MNTCVSLQRKKRSQKVGDQSSTIGTDDRQVDASLQHSHHTPFIPLQRHVKRLRQQQAKALLERDTLARELVVGREAGGVRRDGRLAGGVDLLLEGETTGGIQPLWLA